MFNVAMVGIISFLILAGLMTFMYKIYSTTSDLFIKRAVVVGFVITFLLTSSFCLGLIFMNFLGIDNVAKEIIPNKINNSWINKSSEDHVCKYCKNKNLDERKQCPHNLFRNSEQKENLSSTEIFDDGEQKLIAFQKCSGKTERKNEKNSRYAKQNKLSIEKNNSNSTKRIVRKQTDFFNKFCQSDKKSDLAILRYNPLGKHDEYQHAYIVFSPTYVVEKLGLKGVNASFFDDVGFEIKDTKENVLRGNSKNKIKSELNGAFPNCIAGVNMKARGDCAFLDIDTREKPASGGSSQFKFNKNKTYTVSFFKNNNFDKQNKFFEFKVTAKPAEYNLFSRLGECTDFYKEFKHPKKFNVKFYLN